MSLSNTPFFSYTPELVLVTLLERLKFEAGPEIYWNMNGLQTPVIKGSKDNSPLLPLKISVVADQKQGSL